MIQTLYTGASGLTGQQKNIDVISNNISNIGTDGYKKTRFDFQDCLYERMISPTDNSPEKNLQRGAGAIVYQTARSFLMGALQTTDRTLDFAIEGKGFFTVSNPNISDITNEGDNFLYTRNGTFYISNEEEGNFLVDAHGRYILNSDNEKIIVSGNPENIAIDANGLLIMKDDQGVEIESVQLGIVDFVNPNGLDDMGYGTYRVSSNVGEIIQMEDAVVVQGSTEASNVEYAEEVTRMIRAQRAYQLAARCVTTADQMMQTANAIRQ